MAKGGPRKIIHFYQTLKHNDHDHDGKLSFKELTKTLGDLRVTLHDPAGLFAIFDPRQSGFIEISVFMCAFVPEMIHERLEVVSDLLAALAPKNKPDLVSMTAMKKAFFPRGHPDFFRKKRADYEIKDEFFQMLNTFLQLSGGAVEEIPRDLLIQFFELVSLAYSDDKEFCDTLIGSFRMDRLCGDARTTKRDNDSDFDSVSVQPSNIRHPFGTAQDMPPARQQHVQPPSRPQTGVPSHREAEPQYQNNQRQEHHSHSSSRQSPDDRYDSRAEERTPTKSHLQKERSPRDFTSPGSYESDIRSRLHSRRPTQRTSRSNCSSDP